MKFILVEDKVTTRVDLWKAVQQQFPELKLLVAEDVPDEAPDTALAKAFRDLALETRRNDTFIEATGEFIQHVAKNNELVYRLFQQLQRQVLAKSKLGIHTLEGIEFVAISDIVYGEAKGNYTDLWLSTGARITTSRKMKLMEESLSPASFFRIHNSYIVNLQHVHKYRRGRGGHLVLLNGHTLPVAPSKRDEFLNWLG